MVVGACSAHGEMRNAYRILVGKKTEGKRLLNKTRRRWEDNIRMDLREIGWEGVDWMRPAQNTDQWQALVNRSNEPSDSMKDEEFLD